jgi:hypothetical protein
LLGLVGSFGGFLESGLELGLRIRPDVTFARLGGRGGLALAPSGLAFLVVARFALAGL